MGRDRILSATVLRLRHFGAAHEASFLTEEEGILRALLYGGAKSKLRAYVSPFNSGILYVYNDPVRNTFKITDFDCRSWRPGIRELYERVSAADELSLTVLKGLGGDFEAAKLAFDESLDALENADAALSCDIVIHFCYRWAGILGLRPPLDAECGLNPKGGAARWLSLTEKLSPKEIARYKMDKTSANEARVFCASLLSETL